MIARFVNDMDVAVEVWKVGDLFSVSIHDLESDEYLPTHCLYGTAEAAITKAREISDFDRAGVSQRQIDVEVERILRLESL